MIEIIINGKKIKAKKGKTILEIAKNNKIEIPNLCYHSDLKPKESCKLCVVKIKGRKGMFTSCSTFAEDGMEIETDSKDIQKTREVNLELIFAQHIEKCGKCVWSNRCKMLNLAKEWGLNINEFEDRKKDFKEYDFGGIIKYDSSKCINCSNCVDICKSQGVGFLELKKDGNFWKVVPSQDKECVYCGQCLTHCPSGAFYADNPTDKIQDAINNKNKFVVFQFAPSIRTSIGEEFNETCGTVVIEKMVAGMKALGADRVFDVSVGADFTTNEEALELIKRIEKKENLPMFTACCPAWVRYVEVYKKELLPNLTTVKSPHIILGGIIKTYFAKKENLNPEDVVVVSVMPCTSKKYEIKREELKVNNLNSVDYVLTTHEFAKMLISKKIDLKTINSQKIDSLFGNSSGSGVIFGATGGVTESALRSAAYKLGEKKADIEFKEFRGFKEIKKAEIEIKGIKLRVAVVNGLGNAEKILEHLNEFDYIEVMSCPGGCIGGGGQPVPTDSEIRKKRAESLYSIDQNKKMKIADENPILKEVYKNIPDLIKKICYTKFN